MNVESLMWVSVEQFNKLMGWPVDKIIKACKIRGIVSEKIHGEYRISIVSLSISALERHITKEFNKDLRSRTKFLESIEQLNVLMGRVLSIACGLPNFSKAYIYMRPFEKRSIDKWLPIMLETKGLKGKLLIKRLRKKYKISYSNYLLHRNKWDKSYRNINSLKVNYHCHQNQKKSEGT